MDINKVKQNIDIFLLTCKYWLQGDTWEEANDYAKVIVKGWK